MYESFFGFNQRPFSHAPNAAHYYPAPGIEQARQTLASCIERAAGPGVLIGPPGVGKTLLCYVLAEQFRDSFQVATLGGASVCTRRALLQNILFELKRPYRDMEEGELRLSLMDYLEPGPTCPNGLLLIIDEAHTLPLRLIEELRLMTNFVREGQARIRLVVSGTVALEERLANTKLESFNQRVTARCYLQSLGYEEQCHYLRAQIAGAGADPDELIDESALLAAYRASDGVPRIVNQIMDHAFVLAFAAGEGRLTGRSIEQAWADLQQLPTPWIDEETTSNQESVVIEFGELDDIAQPYVDERMDESEIEVSELSELYDSRQDGESPGLRVAAVGDEYECEFELGEGVEFESPNVPQAFNPFEEQFEEEEVILDRHASLENVNIRSRLRVSSKTDNPWQLLAELSDNEINAISPTPKPDPVTPIVDRDSRSSIAPTMNALDAVSDLALDDPWAMASDDSADSAPLESSAGNYEYSTNLENSADRTLDLLESERELYETLLDPASDPVLPEHFDAHAPAPATFADQEEQSYSDAKNQVEALVSDVRRQTVNHHQFGVSTPPAVLGDDLSQVLSSTSANDESVCNVDELLSFGTSVQQLELRVAPTDDRDMILIEDEPNARRNGTESLVHPDYQQILAQMRQP
ncbi:MAG: type II secretory pathway predicted ATPase ExeA [Pirellulaceae bacterium]|jgi:type II secretory pathway predicted ATPase ExeA